MSFLVVIRAIITTYPIIYPNINHSLGVAATLVDPSIKARKHLCKLVSVINTEKNILGTLTGDSVWEYHNKASRNSFTKRHLKINLR